MSSVVAETQINMQKLFVRSCMNRYNEEVHIAGFTGEAPRFSSVARVIEELVLPAQIWLAEEDGVTDIQARFIVALSGSFHDEGNEPIYFLARMYDQAGDEAWTLLERFAEVVGRNPYPLDREDPQDTQDYELIQEMMLIFRRMNVHEPDTRYS